MNIEEKLDKKIKRREKKRKTKMRVSGKSVFKIQGIIKGRIKINK